MIVTELLGGLGNQLFQYAAGRALAKKRNQQLYLGIDHFKYYTLRRYELHHYQIEEKFMTPEMIHAFNLKFRFKPKNFFERVLHRLSPLTAKPGWVEVKEQNNFVHEPHILDVPAENIYLIGYWQSPLYFEAIADDIRKELTLKNSPTGKNAEFIDLFNQKKVVSVHIRRGDYVSNSDAASFHGSCTPEYYQAAAQRMIEQLKPDHFVVFSDDIPWCRENIRFSIDTIYADHNDPDHGHEDIRLMQNCRGHIIANSTFSWWGAWLAGSRSEKVIAPNNWTQKFQGQKNDIYPKNWELI